MALEDAEAALVWNAELARRQDQHVAEVARLLRAWPAGVEVTLAYGPGLEATGRVRELGEVFVELEFGDRVRTVMLVHVTAVGGVEVVRLAIGQAG